MIARHFLLYTASKTAAAAINLLSVAIFARMAGASAYGEYLLIMSVAYIIYGFGVQWLRNAFFAQYTAETAASHISLILKLVAIILAADFAVAGVLVFTGFATAPYAAGVALSVAGLAFFDCLHEITRTRLRAELAFVTSLTRAVLMLVLGCSALYMTSSGAALAGAIGVANFISGSLMLRDLGPLKSAALSRDLLVQYGKYGAPLVVAFGVNAIGQSSDRLLLAKYASVAALGPYGAVGDIIRQSLVVISEAIAGSYISIARAEATEGRHASARNVLVQSFRAYCAITGVVGLLLLAFSSELLLVLLGQDFAASAGPLVPFLVVANITSIFRAFYFGQSIFFSDSSVWELRATIVSVVVGILSGLLLIPNYGAMGAAVAFLCANAAGCVVSVLGAKRQGYLPMPLTDFLAIVGICGGAALLCSAVDGVLQTPLLIVALKLTIIGGLAAGLGYGYDIAGCRDLISKVRLASSKFATGAP